MIARRGAVFGDFVKEGGNGSDCWKETAVATKIRRELKETDCSLCETLTFAHSVPLKAYSPNSVALDWILENLIDFPMVVSEAIHSISLI